jgi:hypothetical protein
VREGLPGSAARSGARPAPVPARPTNGVAGRLCAVPAPQLLAPRRLLSRWEPEVHPVGQPPLQIGSEAPRAEAAGRICRAHRAGFALGTGDRGGALAVVAARVGGQ